MAAADHNAHLQQQRQNRGFVRPAVSRVGALVKACLKHHGTLSRPKAKALRKAFLAALPERDLEHTRIRGLRSGVLTIEVDSPARRAELQRYERHAILAALNRELAGKKRIDELRFVLTPGAPESTIGAPGAREAGAPPLPLADVDDPELFVP